MVRLLDKSFSSKAIYGLITVLAVLLVMEEHPPTALVGVLTLLGTTAAIALAEAYCETIAEMLAQKRRLTSIELREIVHDVAPVLVGAQGPTFLFLISVFGLFPVNVAIELSKWVILAQLFAYGFRVGQVLHQRLLFQFISGFAMLAAGGLIVLIKVLFH